MSKMAGRQRKNKPLRYYDYSLLFLIIFLLCFGLVMLYSSSSYLCANSSLYGYDAAFYLKKQLRNYCKLVEGHKVISESAFSLFAVENNETTSENEPVVVEYLFEELQVQ